MKRCLVCNAESFHLDFCSQECQNEYSHLMEEMDDDICPLSGLTEEQELELFANYTNKTEPE